MADNSIVKKSIQIDAGASVRTVKSLKQEIADLRDELLNLEKGTEEYDEAQKQLQEDVNDLNEVMGAHKEKAQSLEGSYNDLQNQLKELKKAWKETNDEVERDEIGKKINELNSQLKEMDASIGDFHRNVGNYQSSWEGLTNVMSNGEKVVDDLEKGIKAFGTAMGMTEDEVNALSKVLKKLKDAFKIAKDISSAQKATEGLSTAQKTAAGTATAMATSNKAAGAATTTMAAAEGTATVATKGLSVAMTGLKAAIISTGIGALIVLLGELVAHFDQVKSKVMEILGLQSKIKPMTANDVGNPGFTQYRLDQIKDDEKVLAHRRDMLEAAGEAERNLLEQELNDLQMLRNEAEGISQQLNDEVDKAYSKLKKRRDGTVKYRNDTEKENFDNVSKSADMARDAVKGYDDAIREAAWAIEVFDEKQKHAAKTNAAGAEELKKWADVVKDPEFQAAWSNIMNSVDKEGKSPVDVLNEQYALALKLAEAWKVEATEIDSFFKGMISDAEDTFQSILDKENQIYEEGLTPVERLEKEKAEWLAKYEEWNQDTLNITKYYDKKIQDEKDRAAAEALQKQKEADDKALEELERLTNEQLNMVDAALSTQEKLDALFNPMFISDTARGDIDQEIEAVQRLYDTQMEYLNNLLESADLTEEAYAGIESRILELTVAFNSQMNVLKKEADYQGKNWAILSRKGVANFQLLEDAASNFSSVFQSLGLENSVAYKGFASAQAIISAILAANRVLAEEPGGAVIKGIAAAATLAAGLANVAAIWAVNPDGSNAGSAMNTTMEQSATPVIGNSTPINYTRNITTAEEQDEMNAPIYVTVTDIEDGINGRRAQVQNSSF